MSRSDAREFTNRYSPSHVWQPGAKCTAGLDRTGNPQRVRLTDRDSSQDNWITFFLSYLQQIVNRTQVPLLSFPQHDGCSPRIFKP
eukprot:350749-Amphidinium_carterae.1